MSEQIKIWLVGNTGLRNPNRIQEGFSVFASSAFVGHLHGRDNELGFMNLLDEKAVSYTHLRAHETGRNLVCRLLLEKKKKTQ